MLLQVLSKPTSLHEFHSKSHQKSTHALSWVKAVQNNCWVWVICFIWAGGGQIKRVHGPFVADDEVGDVVDHVKGQAEPDYMDTSVGAMGGASVFDMFGEGGDGDSEPVDELYDEAVALVAREGKSIYIIYPTLPQNRI